MGCKPAEANEAGDGHSPTTDLGATTNLPGLARQLSTWCSLLPQKATGAPSGSAKAHHSIMHQPRPCHTVLSAVCLNALSSYIPRAFRPAIVFKKITIFIMGGGSCQSLFIYNLICFKSREGERDSQGWAKELHLGLPNRCHLSRRHHQEAGMESRPGTQSQNISMGCGHPTWQFNFCTKGLPKILLYNGKL